MIEDVFEGFFKVISRFIGYFLIEIVFELIIKGTGYCIYKLFSDKEPASDELAITILGILFWLVISVFGYLIYK